MSISESTNLTQSNVETATALTQATFFQRLSSSYTTWISSNLRWTQTSEKELEASETKIFSYLKTKFKTYAVDVRDEQDEEQRKRKRCNKEEERKIWTIEMEDPKTNKPPILLLHGFAAGIPFWTLNLDAISKVRHVYAIDVLGFGRSTRPDLSRKENPEDDIVDSIEIWRQNVGVDKFVLLGHSFGAYIASSYAMKYGDHLDRLVLADPWGFSEKTVSDNVTRKVPAWARAIIKVSMMFNPLAIIRFAGPYGPKLVTFRDDLRRKFIPLMGDESKEILNYVYLSNALTPAGESVFKALLTEGAKAKRPIIQRANQFPENLKLNFLYANQSWLYRESEEDLRKLLPKHKIDYQILDNAGHHLYSDNAEGFNEYINNLEETQRFKSNSQL